MSHVLITGSSSGIGEALAHRLLNEGNTVVGLARNFSKSTLVHPHYERVEVDLGNLDKLPQTLKQLTTRYAEVDTLILNAGRGLLGGLEQYSYEQIRQLMELNFLSQVYVTKAFLPLIKRRGSGQCVFMGSESALAGKRQGSVYCGTKFALRGFVQALREECATAGVRVTLVNPGVVNTPFFEGLCIRPGEERRHSLRAEDVAQAVSDLLRLDPHVVVDELNLSPLVQQVRRQ